MITVKEIHLKELYPCLANGDCDPRLVCYLQEDMEAMRPFSASRPAMLVIPGGGYTHYGMKEADPVALEFMNQGFQVFTLFYSLDPHHYPQQVLEMAAAMNYIHENAEALFVDKTKVGMIGFSAGGHMVASYSTHAWRPEIQGKIKAPAANAAITGYAVLEEHSCIRIFAGKEEMTEEDRLFFSPSANINEMTPPTFLWHTATDPGVTVMNSIEYATALIKKGIPTELHIFPKGPHALSTATRQSVLDPHGEIAESVHGWIPLVMTWLKQLFKL